MRVGALSSGCGRVRRSRVCAQKQAFQAYCISLLGQHALQLADMCGEVVWGVPALKRRLLDRRIAALEQEPSADLEGARSNWRRLWLFVSKMHATSAGTVPGSPYYRCSSRDDHFSWSCSDLKYRLTPKTDSNSHLFFHPGCGKHQISAPLFYRPNKSIELKTPSRDSEHDPGVVRSRLDELQAASPRPLL